MKTAIKHYLFGLTICFCHLTSFAQNKNIDSLQTLLKTDKADTNKVNHSNKLCEEYINIFLYDTALHYSNAALQLAQQLNFKKGINISLGYIAVVYLVQGDYSKALYQGLKALKVEEELGDKSRIPKLLNNIGTAYFYQGEYPKALEYYFKALKIAEDLGDKDHIDTYTGNIGNVFRNQFDYPKALEYYFKALKISENLGKKDLIANWLCSIGSVYDSKIEKSPPSLKEDLCNKALDYYFKALRIDEEIGNKRGISIMLSCVGRIYNLQGDNDRALNYYFKALKMAEELKDNFVIAWNIGNIGMIYSESAGNQPTLQMRRARYIKAEQYLKKAISFNESIHALDNLRTYEEAISCLYDTLGQHKEALIHYRKSMILKDTVFSQENKKQLVRKEMIYQFDKKEAVTKAETDKQKAVAEEKNRRQIIISWSIACGLLLVVMFAGFVFRTLRITRKQKNIIELQKNEVTKQKDVAEKQKEIADSQRIIAEELRGIAETQKHKVEEHQKEIIDSITYARRIQRALLTSDEYIINNLPAEHFILFKPKDIVSGDFYWALSIASLPGWDMGTNKVQLPSDCKRQNTFYVATADCTGHGVPGAFMSMLNISFLNENVIERGIRLPQDILNAQRIEIIKALNPAGSTEECKDGMDCILCVYDFDKMLLHFAAANNPLWLIRGGELVEYKADKMPVGKYSEEMHSFTLQTIELQKGDVIYTSTDGFADQFGTNGKKLMKKKLKEELLTIHCQPINDQKEHLNHFFENWKGNTEQIDDVTIIGVRI